MTKPHVLVLSPHAGIADGLVGLLSLGGRYDVRRASSPSEIGAIASRWQADAVLVDGTFLRNADGELALPAPAFVLTGTFADAEPLLPRVPTAKGWLRKDPTYPELERALASVGAASPPLLAGRARLLAAALFAAVILAAALASLWLVFN